MRRLPGARHPFDDRVDRFQVGGIGGEPDRNLAVRGLQAAGRAKVVLDVPHAALLEVGLVDGSECPFAFEPAKHLTVGHADEMGEDVQAAAVGHAELERCDPVRGSLPGELVEQWHQRVEAFERERLLAGKDFAQVLLERLRAHQPFEERALGGRLERAAMASALDFPSQPVTLLATCYVLDLVGDRAAVGVPEARQNVGERLPRPRDAEHVGGDARELGLRQRRVQLRRVQRRIADRLGAERVEPCGEMAEPAVRFDQRHCGDDGAGRDGGMGQRLERERGELRAVRHEVRPPFGRHALGVGEVALEELVDVAEVVGVGEHAARAFVVASFSVLEPCGFPSITSASSPLLDAADSSVRVVPAVVQWVATQEENRSGTRVKGETHK